MTREELNKFIADFQNENKGKKTWKAFQYLHETLWEDVSDNFGALKGQSEEFESYGLKTIAIIKKTHCVDFSSLNKPQELYRYCMVYGKQTVYVTDSYRTMLYFLNGFVEALRIQCEND